MASAGWGGVAGAAGRRAILFVSHSERGLSPLGSKFFRDLLRYYGLRPHDIAPNSILHVSAFIALCEVYIGCASSLLLWLDLFQCKQQREKSGGNFLVCDAVTFQLRRTSSDIYPKPNFVSKVAHWQNSYFYCTSTIPDGEAGFLPSTLTPFEPGVHLSDKAATADRAKVETLKSRIYILKCRGLSFRNLICCWVENRIQPLQPRSALLSTYSSVVPDSLCGTRDLVPSRLCRWRLSPLLGWKRARQQLLGNFQ